MVDRVLKKGFCFTVMILLLLLAAACSSNSSSQGEDLDITEIKDIEATGEFSEDEFFASEGDFNLNEEKLVEEVPGLEDDFAQLEGDAAISGDTLEGLDFKVEGEEATTLDAADNLFSDADLNIEELAEDKSSTGVEIESEDLNLDDLGFGEETAAIPPGQEPLGMESETDLFADETSTPQPLSEQPLAMESEEDLFRDSGVESQPITETMQPTFEPSSETAAIEAPVYEEPVAEEQSASQMLGEDVSIDVDYTQQAAPATSSSQQQLAYDSSYDTNQGDLAATEVENNGLIPVKKMKTVPYTRNGVLVNAIYFVRSGDTLSSIANKVYGSGSGVDFRIVNPHLEEGNLRVGQKVYYNSPVRPQDKSRILTYYEDVNSPTKFYNAAKGENIRTVSKELLGHDRSWMEVWATNQQIESKWALEGNFDIRYWEGGQVPPPAPTLAQNNTQATPPDLEMKSGSKTAEVTEVMLNEDPFEEEMAAEDPFAAVEEEPNFENNPVAQNDLGQSGSKGDLGGGEPAFEDPFAEDPASGFDNKTDTAGTGSVASEGNSEDRDIARNNGAFPAKPKSMLSPENVKLGVIALGGLLLVLVAIMIIKKRKASNNIEMESFDFGGDTTIEDAETKTQIDL